MATEIKYSSGQIAVALNSDGTGYAYYPNGAVAVAVSCASDYQNSFFAFDKNRKASVLLGIDELGNGFANSTSRKSAEVTPRIIVLSKIGCLVTESGNIIWEWRWDRRSMNAGVEPSATIEAILNENLTFSLRDRSQLGLSFACNGVNYVFDLGAKVRRTDNYLEHVKREPDGKLVPQIEFKTLKERQLLFNESMRSQRNKLHPRSENLSEMVRGVVSSLESRFEGIDDKMCTSPGLGTLWKTIALDNTVSEIPRIPIAGTETGAVTGFGDKIYVPANELKLSQTLPANLLVDGKWKDEADIRTALREVNPVLQRSRILGANSGRYSTLLVVNKDIIDADNPTGMMRPLGVPLSNIRWPTLKNMIGAAGASTALTVVLFLRSGDAKCVGAERVLEIVNIDVTGASPGSLATAPGGAASGSYSHQENMKQVVSKGVRLFRMDVGENNDAVAELGIKHLPTFVMYQGRNLAYCGVVGGQKLKLPAACPRPQVLLIEPIVKHQISLEKILRRYDCDVFLCLSINEAVERVRQFSSGSDPRTKIVFDLVLISEDMQTSSDLTLLCRVLSEFLSVKRTVMAGLVSVLGDSGPAALRSVDWQDAFTTNVQGCLRSPLAGCVSAAVQKPLKPSALQKLLDMRVVPADDENFGLTPESLVALIAQVQKGSSPGSVPVMAAPFEEVAGATGGGYVGIRLSAEDTKMRGRPLVKK